MLVWACVQVRIADMNMRLILFYVDVRYIQGSVDRRSTVQCQYRWGLDHCSAGIPVQASGIRKPFAPMEFHISLNPPIGVAALKAQADTLLVAAITEREGCVPVKVHYLLITINRK